MRPRTIGLVLVVVWTGISFLACGTSPGGSTGASTGTTGTGGTPNCDGLFFAFGDDGGDPCNICAQQKCCAELAACPSDHCLLCAAAGGDDGDGSCADVNAQWRALRTCGSNLCQPMCFPTCAPGFCPDGGDGG